DDRGHHQFRKRDEPANDSGLASRSLSGHVPLQAGARPRLAGRRKCATPDRARNAGRFAQLSAPEPHRNLPLGRRVLPAFLLPGTEDRLDPGRDDPQSRDDEAPAARRAGILPVPAPTPGAGALKQLVVTADDFGLAREVNEAV